MLQLLTAMIKKTRSVARLNSPKYAIFTIRNKFSSWGGALPFPYPSLTREGIPHSPPQRLKWPSILAPSAVPQFSSSCFTENLYLPVSLVRSFTEPR